MALATALFGLPAAPAFAQQVVYIGSVQVATGDYIFTEQLPASSSSTAWN
jgi:hypothetical protein